MTNQPARAVLSLGKFPIVKLTSTHFTVKLGGTTEMTIPRNPAFDLRDGDLLTLYTEVLLKGASDGR